MERGIADFGQSMGVTAIGLARLKTADPENKSPALETFGYKQLIFEPFFGGGLVTAISIPVMVATGSVYWILVPMAIVFVVSITGGMIYRRGVRSGRWKDPSVEMQQEFRE